MFSCDKSVTDSSFLNRLDPLLSSFSDPDPSYFSEYCITKFIIWYCITKFIIWSLIRVPYVYYLSLVTSGIYYENFWSVMWCVKNSFCINRREMDWIWIRKVRTDLRIWIRRKKFTDPDHRLQTLVFYQLCGARRRKNSTIMRRPYKLKTIGKANICRTCLVVVLALFRRRVVSFSCSSGMICLGTCTRYFRFLSAPTVHKSGVLAC